MNSELRVGGPLREVEADEIAFRCIAPKPEEERRGVHWLRFIGVVRRRSFKLFLQPLPDRFVARSS